MRTVVSGLLLALSLASCRRGAETESPPADLPRPLAGFATQRLVVTPTTHVRPDSLGWLQQLGGARGMARRLDSLLAGALDARGLAGRWVMPAALVRTWERNRTYATDPYQLTADALRLTSFKTGDKYGEPLSSQLRTMIALEEDARYVLLPVDLRFERAGAAQRAIVRIALLDPRLAQARWVTDVRGDVATTVDAALSSATQRLADLFVAP